MQLSIHVYESRSSCNCLVLEFTSAINHVSIYSSDENVEDCSCICQNFFLVEVAVVFGTFRTSLLRFQRSIQQSALSWNVCNCRSFSIIQCSHWEGSHKVPLQRKPFTANHDVRDTLIERCYVEDFKWKIETVLSKHLEFMNFSYTPISLIIPYCPQSIILKHECASLMAKYDARETLVIVVHRVIFGRVNQCSVLTVYSSNSDRIIP